MAQLCVAQNSPKTAGVAGNESGFGDTVTMEGPGEPGRDVTPTGQAPIKRDIQGKPTPVQPY